MNEDIQKKHYNEINNQYKFDLILSPPVHVNEEINTIIRNLKNHNSNFSKILDFGSGAGRLSIPLLKNGYSVLAVDISKESLKTLKKRTKKLSLNSLKTSQSIPSNEKYDAIVGTDILHHLELSKYLPILSGALKKNGIVIFSEPNALNLAWYIYLPIFQKWSVEKGVVYNSYFNLYRQFKKAGFKSIKIYGFGLLPRPIFNFSKTLCKLNDQMGNLSLFKLFSYRFIIKAVK